jgi:CubicO group peptidase (beta-lactamase class C family)
MSFTRATYYKLAIILFLFAVIAVISSSIRLQLLGANIEKDEIVNPGTKKQIDRIFYEEKANKLDSVLKSITSKNHFNGNILVAYKGNCIFKESFGYADLIKKEELTTESVFQLASLSKQFTAMAVMILKEQGKINYDDSVTMYIPEIPYKGITIRMLLNHTAGLPNYMWLTEKHWTEKSIPYNEDIIKLLATTNTPLYFTPGRRFDYSNTGYVLLASIVERVSRKRFSKFMEEEVFIPLGMENTFVYSASFKNRKDKLNGYHIRGKRYRVVDETINDGTVGDKGIYSTLDDLFKWDQSLYENVLVSEETMSEALSGFKIRNKYNVNYGFGFRLTQHNDKKVVYHHGRWNGFRTSIYRFVEDSNTIIILNHTSTALNSTIIRNIESVFCDSTQNDITGDLISTIIDSGLESGVKKYYNFKTSGDVILDTLKLNQASGILFKEKNLKVAEKINLFKTMYVQGELDTNFMDEKYFLKSISLAN